VRGAFGGEIRRQCFGIGNAGEVCAFKDVLVVGFGGEKKGRGFGVDDRCNDNS